jgi:hypothetical protein
VSSLSAARAAASELRERRGVSAARPEAASPQTHLAETGAKSCDTLTGSPEAMHASAGDWAARSGAERFVR